MHSVAGASAGSINALLSAMYWCQKDSVPLKNSVDDNLFYETWVNLGIKDLVIKGEDLENKNSLLTQKGLQKKVTRSSSISKSLSLKKIVKYLWVLP